MQEALAPEPEPRPSPSKLLAMIVAATMFMAQLDGTIITTALPQMAHGFGVRPISLSIGISAYLLMQVVMLPASNWVSDRLGARRVFASAVVIFTLSSLLCGLSRDLPLFIMARILQGGAAALMTPVGRVVLIRATPKADLVQILTMTSVPMLLAPTLGPPLGGFIVSYLSWPWVFFINIPVGLVAVPMILRFVPNFRQTEHRPFDFLGFVITGVALAGLIYGLDRITAPDIDRTIPAISLAIGLLVGWWAVRHALAAAHPLLSLKPLRYPTFRISTLGGGAIARMPMRALPFIMPLLLQVGMGLSAVVSGLMVMSLSGADLVSKPLVKRVLQTFGYRQALLGSMAVVSLGMFILALLRAGTPLSLICIGLVVIGAARSVLFSGMSSLLFVDIEDTETGAANVLWNVAQQLSNAFAISLTVIILNAAAWSHGHYGAAPALGDFKLALMIFAIMGLPALWSFAKLAPDAGQKLSGHRG